MSSKIALKIYAMVKESIIKSNAHFWRDFSFDVINNYEIDYEMYAQDLSEKDIQLICVFDDDFPKFDLKLKNSERPYLFAYKGNWGLINNIKVNVAVVGVLSPTVDIEKRENKIIKSLVEKDINIVSGLARGCDTVAHKTTLDYYGKTIAILPTTLSKIYPKENEWLVERIVENNGLVLTEYVVEAKNKYESIKRFIERDRLQAMLSGTVILVASFLHGCGDSGSRHAMQKAKEYGKKRFVMFNPVTDTNNPIFGLNKKLLDDGVDILTERDIEELKTN